MRGLYIFLALCWIIPVPCTAQILSGVVSDSKGKPIEYVNIGIVGKDVGTVSGTDGTYRLTADERFNEDTIRFSCIGYVPFSMKVSDFKALASKNVMLLPYVPVLREVIVRPMKGKNIVLGKRFKKVPRLNAGFQGVDKGYELGTVYEIKKKTLLKKIMLQVFENSCDTLTLRLNIRRKTGSGWEAVTSKQIIFTIPARLQGNLEIDLIRRDLEDVIIEKSTILVSVEWLGGKDAGGFYLSAAFGDSDNLYRGTSQGKWKKAPVKLALSIDAFQER